MKSPTAQKSPNIDLGLPWVKAKFKVTYILEAYILQKNRIRGCYC